MKFLFLLLLFAVAVAATVRALIEIRRKPEPLRPAPRGQLVTQHMRIGRMDRSFLIYVPSNYSADRPPPLVLAFHGGSGTAARMARQTGLHNLAEEKQFIAVYPQGTGFGFRPGATWNAGGNPPQGWAEHHKIDDVGFVRQLIGQIASLYRIDKARVYVMGVSKGGMLAYHLACNLSDTVAAIGVVAGTMTAANCSPQSAVAVMHIHGTADQNVPLEGGRGARTAPRANWPPVARGLAYWRHRNGCTAAPRLIVGQDSVKCWQYDAPETGADVRFCVIEGGGHVWPGSSQRQDRGHVESFSATRALWDFFEEHPRAAVSPAHQAPRTVDA